MAAKLDLNNDDSKNTKMEMIAKLNLIKDDSKKSKVGMIAKLDSIKDQFDQKAGELETIKSEKTKELLIEKNLS